MLRIGELAELTGVTTRTIRHYHRIGLLPQATRQANGYRRYGLADAVRLVRVRRLAALGMSLDEVADALADDAGRDLREILAELDAGLAADEAAIRARREAIAALLAHDGDLRVPAELAPLADRLADLFGGDAAGLERERLVLELLGPVTGSPAATVDVYERMLADPDVRGRLADLGRRFTALAEVDAADPAVDALVADGTGLGEAVVALLPADVRDSPGDPRAAGLLLDAVTAGMAPAQVRCLTLQFDAWREQTS